MAKLIIHVHLTDFYCWSPVACIYVVFLVQAGVKNWSQTLSYVRYLTLSEIGKRFYRIVRYLTLNEIGRGFIELTCLYMLWVLYSSSIQTTCDTFRACILERMPAVFSSSLFFIAFLFLYLFLPCMKSCMISNMIQCTCTVGVLLL